MFFSLVIMIDRCGCALHNMRVRKEVGIIVRANMHSLFINIEDGSPGAIENAELFFSPSGLFCMVG
jgi:hypothetical protein